MKTYTILWYNDELRTITDNELSDLMIEAMERGDCVEQAKLPPKWGIDYWVRYW